MLEKNVQIFSQHLEELNLKNQKLDLEIRVERARR